MDLTKRLLSEPVAGVDQRMLVAVPRDTTVREAIRRMTSRRQGCVVVVDADGRPQGTFTERLVVRLLLQQPGAMEEKVSDHMLAPAAVVGPTTSVADLIDCMESKKLRFVCLVDEAGKALAVVGQKGVVKFLASHYPQVVQGNALESTLNVRTREGA